MRRYIQALAFTLGGCFGGVALGADDPTEWSRKVFTIGNGVSTALAADRGDLNNIFRRLDNQNCTPRRCRNLSRAYEGYIDAAVSQDPDRMYRAARHFRRTVYRSTMYTSCWRTIRKQAKAGGRALESARQIVKLGPNPAPKTKAKA